MLADIRNKCKFFPAKRALFPMRCDPPERPEAISLRVDYAVKDSHPGLLRPFVDERFSQLVINFFSQFLEGRLAAVPVSEAELKHRSHSFVAVMVGRSLLRLNPRWEFNRPHEVANNPAEGHSGSSS